MKERAKGEGKGGVRYFSTSKKKGSSKKNYYLVHIPLSDVINASVLNELMKVIEGIGREKKETWKW